WRWCACPTTSSSRMSSPVRSQSCRGSPGRRRWWPSRRTRGTISRNCSRLGSEGVRQSGPMALQSRYGPTLGELLAPRWQRASRALRAVVVLAGVLLAVAILGAVLTLEHPRLESSGGTPVSFSFSYPGLYRAPSARGELALVRRTKGGRLEDSFAVAPLELARYRGEPSAALALYASDAIRRLAA